MLAQILLYKGGEIRKFSIKKPGTAAKLEFAAVFVFRVEVVKRVAIQGWSDDWGKDAATRFHAAFRDRANQCVDNRDC